MKTIKTIGVAVVGEGVIDPEAIHKAVYVFRREYIDRPNELVVSPAAHMTITKIAYIQGFNPFGGVEMYEDMKVTVDPNLNDDSEWMVRKIDEKWYELKSPDNKNKVGASSNTPAPLSADSLREALENLVTDAYSIKWNPKIHISLKPDAIEARIDTAYIEVEQIIAAALQSERQRWIEIIDGLHQVHPATKEVLPHVESEWNEAIDDVIAALATMPGEQAANEGKQ